MMTLQKHVFDGRGVRNVLPQHSGIVRFMLSPDVLLCSSKTANPFLLKVSELDILFSHILLMMACPSLNLVYSHRNCSVCHWPITCIENEIILWLSAESKD